MRRSDELLEKKSVYFKKKKKTRYIYEVVNPGVQKVKGEDVITDLRKKPKWRQNETIKKNLSANEFNKLINDLTC